MVLFLSVCLCTCVCNAHGSQKMVLDPLELELQMAVSRRERAGNWTFCRLQNSAAESHGGHVPLIAKREAV